MVVRLLLLCGVLVMAGCASAGGPSAAMVMEEFRGPSDAGIEIYVRNKRAANLTQFSPARPISATSNWAKARIPSSWRRIA